MPPPPRRRPQRQQQARSARAARRDARAPAPAPPARPPRPWRRTAAQAASPAQCCAPLGTKTSQPAHESFIARKRLSVRGRVAAETSASAQRVACLILRRQRPAMRLRCAAAEQSKRAGGGVRAASATRCLARCTRRAASHVHIATARQRRGARTLHCDGDRERYHCGDERRPRRARRQLSAQRGARGLGAAALGATRRRLGLLAGGAWCFGRRRRRKVRRKRDALGLGDARHAPPRRREQGHR